MEVFVFGVAVGVLAGAGATLASLYLTLRVRFMSDGSAAEPS